MTFFKILKQTKQAFRYESEESLSYLYGFQHNHVMFHGKADKPKYSGFFLRSLAFFASIAFNFRFKRIQLVRKPLLIFAGTDNQFNSLKPTIAALDNQQVDYELLLGKGVSQKNILSYPHGHLVLFGFKEVILAVMFYFFRGIPLYFKLKKQHRQIEIDWHFNNFCQAYVFVPYFLNVLRRVQPGLVVISNDHNVNNRSLRLAAEVLGVQTLYMQHASVSDIFPPLEFDYALLDGQTAHQTYLQCYAIQKGVNPRIENNVTKCQVILSGQKKPVVPAAILDATKKDCLGLAVNQIDDFHCVEALLDELATMQVQCIVRTHPFQNPIFIGQLKSYMKDKDWLTWSNSREEGLADYFSKVNAVIAGNTSIHLEAALAGLATIYYEMSDEVHRPDYYGYVKNGISLKLEQGLTFDELETAIESAHSSVRNQAIKNYSETYGTAWQNREGELSAWVIQKILKNESLDAFFVSEESDVYKTVLKLEE